MPQLQLFFFLLRCVKSAMAPLALESRRNGDASFFSCLLHSLQKKMAFFLVQFHRSFFPFSFDGGGRRIGKAVSFTTFNRGKPQCANKMSGRGG